MQPETRFDYDFIVVGSGFGGSVSACRLAEKGYSVAVLEMGKRWTPENFPETTWNSGPGSGGPGSSCSASSTCGRSGTS